MLFNSIEFLFFFVLVTSLYFILPHRLRWLLLLLASCYFYMAFVPIYILILFFTIVIDYIAGILIENARGSRRKFFLIASLISNIGVLAFYKYYNFLNHNLETLWNFFGGHYPFPALNIILAIGLSFHTFQAMSYTIEVYRGRQKAERHFGIYALYVMFYPQLVAGPIERPQNLLHQFREVHSLDYSRLTDGLKLMLWGLFKKVVIADRLAIFVDTVYKQPAATDGILLLVGTVFFAFQIYCDFSGYSDIAIGSAQAMGFKLMDNFNRPYSARSIAEFWKRWHISLSTWFRDYLYIPLGGNRTSYTRWQFNLFLTFLLSGLWHGAKWTYVVWGALNGFYLIFGMWTEKGRKALAAFTGLSRFPRLHTVIKRCLTFSLVCFAWIFFRADSLRDAFLIIGRLFDHFPHWINPAYLKEVFVEEKMGFRSKDLMLCLASILFLEFVHWIQKHGSIRHMLREKPRWIRWAVYYVMIFSILLFGIFKRTNFIYFQF